MALKTIRVQLKSLDEFLNETFMSMRKIRDGKKVKKQSATYFESLDVARSVITETRLSLIRLIRERSPKSIAELARIAKRDFKSVHADVDLLKSLGIVKVIGKGRGSASGLTSDTTEISVRIAV
jgi:predicted transcriptional regulator